MKRGYFSKIEVWILLLKMLLSEQFTYERRAKIKKKYKNLNKHTNG